MVLKLTLWKDQTLHVPQKFLIGNLKKVLQMQKLRNLNKKELPLNVKEKKMTLYILYPLEERKIVHLEPY